MKFVKNEKDRPKGIMQLLNFIDSIDQNGLPFDQFKGNKAVIYPIIVFTDTAFDAHFVNYYLNLKFKEQISNRNMIPQVKNLIMIQIDTLVELQDLFNDKKLKLQDCLDSYLHNLKKASDYFECFEPFSLHISNITRNNGLVYGKPRILEPFTKELFKK